jgi:hypothetical protein
VHESKLALKVANCDRFLVVKLQDEPMRFVTIVAVEESNDDSRCVESAFEANFDDLAEAIQLRQGTIRWEVDGVVKVIHDTYMVGQ